MKKIGGICLFLAILTSCNEEYGSLLSVEDRKAAATQNLIAELTNPTLGWRLDYRPTSQAGTFLMLLTFYENGTVRILSDVSDNNGEFLDQVIPYRIDHDLATELVLETYGVFHYLFELNQNSFGAEFEFLFQQKSGNNLIFQSKSDFSDITTLIFQPATVNDFNLISTDIVNQLSQGGYRQEKLADLGQNLIYHFYLPEDDMTIFTTLDLSNRKAKLNGASVGRTYDEILENDLGVSIGATRNISFLANEIVFSSPVQFSLNGNNYSIAGFKPDNFQLRDTSYCIESTTYADFAASATGYGQGSFRSSLFTRHSTFYNEDSEFYTSNSFFAYDANNESIIDYLIENFAYPDVFVLIYNSFPIGYDGAFTGVGWAGFDDRNKVQFYTRGVNVLNIVGNRLELELTNDTYITESDSLDERDALFNITDQMFEGGIVYATEILSIDGLFEVYNPCNGYKIFVIE